MIGRQVAFIDGSVVATCKYYVFHHSFAAGPKRVNRRHLIEVLLVISVLFCIDSSGHYPIRIAGPLMIILQRCKAQIVVFVAVKVWPRKGKALAGGWLIHIILQIPDYPRHNVCLFVYQARKTI